jgi:HlyD family secretion protein
METLLKKLAFLLLALAAGVVAWGVFRKSAPPRVNVTAARRQTLVSTLPTNGKVEPFEWQAVRAEAEGTVSRLNIKDGQNVVRGQILATVSEPSLPADIEAAQAKVAEARAALAGLEAGGRPADLTDIDNRLARARYDLQQATSDYNSLRRLEEKSAATRVDVQAAHDRVRQAEIEIEGLQKRRGVLVAKPDVTAAEARLRDAENALSLAQARQALSVVKAPLAGAVYGLAVQTGAYVTAGTLIADIGQTDRLRVRVYVDEPELGRVAVGEPVTIRWQAMPGSQWDGVVERKPASIQALGSRQVGEVVCTIGNPSRELIPGTNVDAEIRTAVAENALVIPREAMRHDTGGDYVLVVKDGVVERRPVRTGATSATLAQIAAGLTEGEAVVLPSDVPLKPGDHVVT